MAEVRGKGYRVIVEDSAQLPKWSRESRILRVGKQWLEADARFSLFGERMAGLLLPSIEYDEELSRLVEAYRIRVMAEQAADLQARIGRLASQVRVRPSYFPYSRARLLWHDLGCLIRDGLEPSTLDGEYSPLASRIGSLEDGLVALAPRKYREVLRVEASKWRIRAAGLLTSIARRLAGELHLCEAGAVGDPVDPSPLVMAPEGDYFHECPKPEGMASRYTGGEASCRRTQWTASTLVCEGPSGRVAVKEYTRMIVKWLPASIAGGGIARYMIRPKARLANEYKYLRLLRDVLPTPRILGFCGQYFQSMMARSFLEGRPVLGSQEPMDWRLSGRALARIHLSGYVLGDANPGNFIASGRGEAGIIDAEQARRFNPRRGAWDLVVYTYYALFFNAPEDLVAEGLRSYTGYLAERDPHIMREIEGNLRDPQLWGPLLLAVNVYQKTRRILDDVFGLS
ncbi:MAG: DIPK family protein [Desulfurococcales archaeon]|nr:DIPK family protein [Desulfurococcales archaeon]